MSTQTTKLRFLLRALWQSPLFGDSFPPVNEQAFLQQYESMVPAFVEKLESVLHIGLPDATEEEIDDLVGQLMPKSLAFCAAIAAGEIEDTERLLQAALIMALVYWVDQSMDRGDEMMLLAVHRIEYDESFDVPAPALSHWNVLQHMQALIRQVAQDPQDVPYAMQSIMEIVLPLQAWLRLKSYEFLKSTDSQAFWQTHSHEIAQSMVDCSGLMTVVSLIYSLYRQQQPTLPDLGTLVAQPPLKTLIHTSLNAAVRVFDDAGDWQVDAGQHQDWGVFNINLFNQSNERFVADFLRSSGMMPGMPQYEQAKNALSLPAAQSRVLTASIYAAWVRQQLAALPREIHEKDAVFLAVVKRVMEAALVNALGDMFLAENAGFNVFDRELFYSLTQR